MISPKLCWIVLFSIVILSAFIQCQEQSAAKVLIDLDALPEPFTDNKLPSWEPQMKRANQNVCYSLMGCYDKIPLFARHLDPMQMKTMFTIAHNDSESLIEVKRCDTCLRNKPDDCDQYPFDLQQLKDSPFDPRRRTIIVVGGYGSKTSNGWESSLKSMWSTLDDVNIIMIEWENYNGGDYQAAAANTRPVARQLTVLLYYLAKMKGNDNLDLKEDAYIDKFYIIGHSLGAHMAGFVGKDLAGRLGRITGLDPAGPFFDTLDSQYRIDRSDARFVDILHTNAGAKILSLKPEFGSALASGHIDLWANSGAHQPGCTNELLGCSHKKAPEYFVSYLNDVISMRKYLGRSYQQMYRLRAYRSDTFDEFRVGTSIAKRCPITALDDSDLTYADLGQCSIPIDYISWYSEYKKELETLHGLNFNKTVTTSLPNNYYFYTSPLSDNQLDHYMVKIRIAKPSDEQANQLARTNGTTNPGCFISFNMIMSNGLDNNYKIDNYQTLHMEDQPEIVFPFLAPNTITKYEVAKIDSDDFFIERRKEDDKEFISNENLARVRESLDQVFPSSVILGGFKDSSVVESDNTANNKEGFFDSIKRFFKGTSKPDNEEVDSKKGIDCQLTVESFVIQPLRKFHRHLSAFYSRDCSKNGTDFEVIVLGPNQPSPKNDLFIQDKAACENAQPDKSPRLVLRTVIIGPKFALEQEEQENGDTLEESSSNEIANLNEINLTESDIPDDESSTDEIKADAKLWLVLSVLLLMFVFAMIALSASTMGRVPISRITNKAETNMYDTNLSYTNMISSRNSFD